MHLVLIILAHFAIYGFPVFVSALFSKKFQLFLNYTYLGVVFCLIQLFDSLYFIQLTDKVYLMGGDIAYSALMFATLFLLLAQAEPEVVRNLIYFISILNVFLSLLFSFLNQIFITTPAVSHLEFSELLLEFSFKSLILSVLLFSSEILLQLFILQKGIRKIKNKVVVSILIAFSYAVILILDGILYPLGINLLFPGSNISIKYSILAKVIFGGGFGLLLIFYLNFFPSQISFFETKPNSFIQYILPPKRKYLLIKYQKAQDEIEQLRQILPICSKCKKIRDDAGYWKQLEDYLAEYNDVYFSHSFCPTCAQEELDEIDEFKKQ